MQWISTLAMILLLSAFPITVQAQFSLSADVGIGYGILNRKIEFQRPTDAFSRIEDATSEIFRAVGREAIALAVDYRPNESSRWGYGVRTQFYARGYQHVVVSDLGNGAVIYEDQITSEAGFIDVMPRVSFSMTNQLRFMGGGYFGLQVSEIREPNRQRGAADLDETDYGAHFGVQLFLRNFYLQGLYQLSLRNFNYAAFTDVNPGNLRLDTTSPVSSIVVGVGYRLSVPNE